MKTDRSRPQLLFLASEYWSFESHKLGMAAAAAQEGFAVTVAARTTPTAKPPADAAFRLVSLPWQRSGSALGAVLRLIPEVLRVRRLLRGIQPQVLHAIDLKPAIVGALAALGRPVAVLHSINGFGFVFFRRSAFARLIQYGCGLVLRLSTRCNGAIVLVQNKADAAVVVDRMKIAPDRVHLIRGSGVDPEAFSAAPLPPTRTFRFLIMSRLLYMKGIHVAVEAHEILRQRGIASELVVCGAPDPGNPSAIPQEVLDRWAAIPGVVLMGHLTDIRPALASCHVALQTALGGEGLPKALLEAGAAGRAMIASDIPGNTEIAVPGETGLLVPPGDALALADAMQWAVTHPADCQRLGTGARQKVEHEFAAGLIREQHARLYRDLVAVHP